MAVLVMILIDNRYSYYIVPVTMMYYILFVNHPHLLVYLMYVHPNTRSLAACCSHIKMSVLMYSGHQVRL
jgi:hypothetical protein